MERRLAVYNSVCILSDLAVEHVRCLIILHYSRRFLADSHTLSTSYALVIIDHSLLVYDLYRIMTAVFLTYAAADAVVRIDHRL